MTFALRSDRGLVNPFDGLNRDLDTFVRRVFDGTDTPGTSYGVNIYETNDQLVVEADLPGFTREQVDVTVDDDVLAINADRSDQAATTGDEGQTAEVTTPQPTWYRRERRVDHVRRSFTLPKTIDGTHVAATLTDGVLRLTLNKREEAKPRKIAIS